ncbi:helix-turn-helix transcriptional regulator [Cupriavidus necator]|uniref:helix-turn-helix domain-containing protein n=1 Tax=Cupriavidus necator TaxID=106590 RepID=UPI003ED134BF
MKSLKLNAAFGKALAKLRRERGWTQEFLSFECNLTRNYISLLERGERSPTLNTIASLAEALKVGEEELVKMTLEELRKELRKASKGSGHGQ